MGIVRKSASAIIAGAIMLSAVIPYSSDTFSVLNTTEITASAADVPYFSNYDDAAVYLRQQLTEHIEEITFQVPVQDSDFSETSDIILASALEETRNSYEGDYLRLSFNRYSVSGYRTSRYYELSYTPRYRITIEQEEYMTQKIAEVIDELDMDGMDDYDKLKTIYEYIINHVDYAYGSSDELRYTAYGALANGSAVCQGYAVLLYRLAKEAGISCRFVSGTAGGGAHAWNIAEINGIYYYLDSTWDDTSVSIKYCNYFLKGTEDFEPVGDSDTHILDAPENPDNIYYIDYTSEEFQSLYPMSLYSYDTENPTYGYSIGDVDGNEKVDSADASMILQTYSILSTGGASPLNHFQERAADLNNDGYINSVDASLTLSYYSYASTGGKDSVENFLKTLIQEG
ncbi:MAG: hypothetical protein K2N49_06920 [Ruminococcus sp.]|nr:hypothetical protein [Ruminococcus sp.]MDE7226570.1 hypothetical protein [Ruminococcus sp.]